MSDLKPCPFFGRSDLLGFEPAERGFLSVRCRACGGQCGGNRAETETEAAATWNRRAQTAQAGLIDEIRDALQNGDVIERATEAQRVVLAQAVPASCGECGKKTSDGWALYCVDCMKKAGLPAQAGHDGLVWREIERGANYIKMEGRFSGQPAQPLITSENGKAPAQGASAITSRSAQAVPLLSDAEVQGCIPTVTLKGEKPVPMVWLKQADAIKAIRAAEQAVRAKMGVAVPMTDAQIDAELDGSWVDDAADFKAGIRAAEKFHGIVGKEGA